MGSVHSTTGGLDYFRAAFSERPRNPPRPQAPSENGASAEPRSQLASRLDEFEIRLGDSFREALEAALRDSDVLVTLIEQDTLNTPNLFFELGAAIGMGRRVVAIVPKDLDPAQLPVELRRRRYLLRDTPQETAEELSHALTAA